jgi:integrase
MFSFAVDKGIIDQHPCLRMAAPGGKLKARTRALTTAKELRVLWRITDPDGIWCREPEAGRSKTKIRNQRFVQGEADALRMVLLTGARASEVTDLPWSELDLDAATWLLPAERSKNNRPHLVPLLPQLVDMLRARRSVVSSGWVFPAKRGGHLTAGHLQRPLRAICARLGRLGLEPFTTHDLRRTVETGMAAAKVPKEYRDRVLNHVDSSVGGVHYNMHDYEDEKREALEKWARRLEGMLTGKESNVVPMRRVG